MQPLMLFSFMSSICALSLARSSGAAMAKNREMAALSLSLPLMLVAFVKIWSDESEIVVLWRGRGGGGKMAGKKEKRGNSGLKRDIA